MSRPRMTRAVREGLKWAMILADSWREADGDETLNNRNVEDLEAADAYIKAGGLDRPHDRPRRGEDAEPPNVSGKSRD